MKMMARASRFALFERRPRVPLPVGNLPFIALGGPLLRLLAREAQRAQRAQQVPQVADAVLDAKAPCDHLADARQCQ